MLIEFNDNVNKAFDEVCKSDKNLAEFKAAITSAEDKGDNNEETRILKNIIYIS